MSDNDLYSFVKKKNGMIKDKTRKGVRESDVQENSSSCKGIVERKEQQIEQYSGNFTN